ncbi:protein NRT1/ PTR FAMILY 5.10-like [Curcuma longa]|uniref:protein NRT1/ PTR FAMILY 5.10-like n=1 Tax=Curcuma longa TaxID=136217 RepID=UPI003D9F6CCC
MATDPLLRSNSDLIQGVVDYRGRPASRSASGGWTAAIFIMGVQIPERMAYYGISANLISYLTGPLRVSTADAAAAINVWNGVGSLLPVLGALVADCYLGRFRTILISSFLYLLGLGMLTLSSVLPIFYSLKYEGASIADQTTCPPSIRLVLLYISLYLVAIAQAGFKPCVQAFGADQFDQGDPRELISRGIFFNWWYFGICIGIVVAIAFSSYVQDNIGWGLGFGIPCMVMLSSLLMLLLGTRTYRIYLSIEGPMARACDKFLALARKLLQNLGFITVEDRGLHQSETGDVEATRLLRLFPVWSMCLMYTVVYAQSATLFTKQGRTLDTRIGIKLHVPPAALQCFIAASIVLCIPIYDRVLVPMARKLTKLPSGITMLQRIGTGIVISMVSMSVAALVEERRLRIAEEFDLLDKPEATIPMSLWWLLPQYILMGVSEVFALIGMQEFFYDQVPDGLRSLGLALYLGIFGIGSFVSGFMISVIDKTTSRGGESWFANNLNHAHLDYFYWLLAGLSAFQLVLYLYFAKDYVYKKNQDTATI